MSPLTHLSDAPQGSPCPGMASGPQRAERGYALAGVAGGGDRPRLHRPLLVAVVVAVVAWLRRPPHGTFGVGGMG